MPTVWVPSLVQDLTGGQEKVTVPGETLRQVINNLDAAYPGMKARLLDDTDRIRRGLAVAIDGSTTHPGMIQPVDPDSNIYFIPAIGGG